MKSKFLLLILLYYAIISITVVVSAGSGAFPEEDFINTTFEVNSSALQSSEIDSGGLFGTGVSFGRFFGIIIFGIGLPNSIGVIPAFIFGLWQSIITIFTVSVIISAIWNG